MTAPDDEIVAAVDVDHLDDRPDDLHHVAIVDDGDDLRARPFTDDDRVPGYVEIDVDLTDYDAGEQVERGDELACCDAAFYGAVDVDQEAADE